MVGAEADSFPLNFRAAMELRPLTNGLRETRPFRHIAGPAHPPTGAFLG
jgi:hypothetical protein